MNKIHNDLSKPDRPGIQPEIVDPAKVISQLQGFLADREAKLVAQEIEIANLKKHLTHVGKQVEQLALKQFRIQLVPMTQEQCSIQHGGPVRD